MGFSLLCYCMYDIYFVAIKIFDFDFEWLRYATAGNEQRSLVQICMLNSMLVTRIQNLGLWLLGTTADRHKEAIGKPVNMDCFH